MCVGGATLRMGCICFFFGWVGRHGEPRVILLERMKRLSSTTDGFGLLPVWVDQALIRNYQVSALVPGVDHL